MLFKVETFNNVLGVTLDYTKHHADIFVPVPVGTKEAGRHLKSTGEKGKVRT